mmetsp:Transcript_2571/g.3482  ORF Transcript_2571/g.3482 Transcript_2571/m.3482 type:complete len:229 (-) Transcript_2571:85-771(-)
MRSACSIPLVMWGMSVEASSRSLYFWTGPAPLLSLYAAGLSMLRLLWAPRGSNDPSLSGRIERARGGAEKGPVWRPADAAVPAAAPAMEEEAAPADPGAAAGFGGGGRGHRSPLVASRSAGGGRGMSSWSADPQGGGGTSFSSSSSGGGGGRERISSVFSGCISPVPVPGAVAAVLRREQSGSSSSTSDSESLSGGGKTKSASLLSAPPAPPPAPADISARIFRCCSL